MDNCLIGQLRTHFPMLLTFPYGGLEVFRGLKAMRAGRYPIIHELFALMDDHQQRTGKAVQLTAIFEEEGLLRFSAHIPDMGAAEANLLELLTESWSEETCEICGSLGFIDVTKELRRCRCIEHQDCSPDQAERDEQDYVRSLAGYQRAGMPVSLFYHVADIQPTSEPHRLRLTVFALPDRVDSLREKSLLTHCTPVHYPDLSKDKFKNLFQSLREEGISPVLLSGHSYID